MSAQSRVFDPGISTESDDETELLLDAVGDIVRGQVDRPLSFREGEFQVEGGSVRLFKRFFSTQERFISPTLAPTLLRSIEGFVEIVYLPTPGGGMLGGSNDKNRDYGSCSWCAIVCVG